MKFTLLTFCIILSTALSLCAADSAAEKAFVDKYQTAFEANDTKTLESLLYKEGAHPMALEFYKMMIREGAGAKIARIELLELSPAEQKKAEGIQEGPGGQKTRMPLKPTRKLQVAVESKGAESSGTTTHTVFVAEKGGSFVIPVPATAK